MGKDKRKRKGKDNNVKEVGKVVAIAGAIGGVGYGISQDGLRIAIL